jgi:hypothetical protein
MEATPRLSPESDFSTLQAVRVKGESEVYDMIGNGDAVFFHWVGTREYFSAGPEENQPLKVALKK